MTLKDYILNDYKPLTLNVSIATVFDMLNTYPFSHFPIIENNKLIGMLDKNDVINVFKTSINVADLYTSFQHFHTHTPDNHFDLIGLFSDFSTNILPVVDAENNYMGYFELDDLIQICNNTPFFQKNGSTLVVEKENDGYSMSEISQIIESNKIKVLGMYVSQKDAIHTQITIRIDTEETNEVIQSLRRYNYHVLTNSKDDFLLEQLKDNAEYLQKYLEI